MLSFCSSFFPIFLHFPLPIGKIIIQYIIMESSSVTEYIKKAFEYKNSGNYKQAIEFLYKALAIDNESSEILNEIANLYFTINNPERAIEYYEQALNIAPKDNEIKYNLAVVYKKIGNIKKSITLLKTVFELEKSIQYLVELLNSYYLEKQYVEVLDLFSHIEDSTLISDAVLYYAGLANIALGDNASAEKFFRKAVNIAPQNYDVKYYLAEILYEQKKYDDAETLLLQIVESKVSAKAYFLLGEIYFLRNDIEKAINYYSISANIDSKNPVCYYELGMAYALKGFLQEAEVCYLKAVKISPNNLLYNYTLAYLYKTQGEITKAKQIISYILTVNPLHTDTLVLKALIMYEEDDVTGANKIIDDVIYTIKSNDLAFYVKSLLYKKLEWWDKAIEFVNKALEIKPDSIEYLSELAYYYYKAKYYGDTKEICKKIIKKDDKFVFAYILLAKVCWKNKDYSGAIKNLNTAISFDNNSDEALFLKAQVLKQKGDVEEAILTARSALLVNPKNVEYYEFIAKCYFDEENYTDAFTYYKEASTVDSFNAKYKYFMAKCSEKKGEVDSAISNYSVAKRMDPTSIEIAIDYAGFLCQCHSYKKAMDVLKSTMKYNHKIKDSEEFLKKYNYISDELYKHSNKLQKFFMKIFK